jgi:hypothetical protein
MCDRRGWGEMYIYSQPRENWSKSGFDNGAYLDWINGRVFNETRYLKALDRAMLQYDMPYLCVTPDLVGGGYKSLDFSMKWLERLPIAWPRYLALQDGMEMNRIAEVVCLFDGVFLGGTDGFKREAEDWCSFAHSYGKNFHYARAGTERKIKHALRIGADSLDSSFPLWTVERIQRMDYLIHEWEHREPRLDFCIPPVSSK